MSKRILMCRPDHYGVEYEINPWMHVEDPVNPAHAQAQWQALYDIYTRDLGWQIELIAPQPDWPDMVFTANGGLVIGGKVMLPCFRQPERQGETPFFRRWFEAAGWARELAQPRHDFEGEGDALLWNDCLFVGYPWRTDRPAHRELAAFFDVEVIGVQLRDARFYHLDTAMTVIDERTVAIYPGAFTSDSLATIRARVPDVIEASTADAMAYGLNGLSDGESVVLSDRASGLIEAYRQRGLRVYPTAISEFQKSGGGVKCLSLELRL